MGFKKIVDNYPTFDVFVREFLDYDIIHEHPLLRPQYLYIYGFGNVCKVDFIGKFENLAADFEYITSKIEISVQLKKINASNRKRYDEYYNDITRKKVHLLYGKDFDLFGYDND